MAKPTSGPTHYHAHHKGHPVQRPAEPGQGYSNQDQHNREDHQVIGACLDPKGLADRARNARVMDDVAQHDRVG